VTLASERLAVGLALVATAGCGASEGTRLPGPPSAVESLALPSASTTVGTSAGAFAVKVTDANGHPVAPTTVTFVTTGTGTASPSSATTDAAGQAQTAIAVGTQAGMMTVTASVAGTTLRVVATVTALAGPLARVVLTPDAVQLRSVGDTARLVAGGVDALDNVIVLANVTFTSMDPGAVTVSSTGTVRAERLEAATGVIATSGGLADTTVVRILAAGASPCTGLALVRSLAVGEVAAFQGVTSACLAGSATGADFAVVAFNADTVRAATTVVSGVGLAAAPSPSRLPASAPTLLRGGTAERGSLVPDAAFHRHILDRAQALRGRYPAARAWMRGRAARSPVPSRGGSAGPAFSAIGATPQVGDLVQLNVNGNDDCVNAILHPARIMAIGTHAIVMADTTNPAGGFTSADYQRYAAQFDTVIYPVDVDAFGAPSDIDGNGRVGILFTRAVNELTPASSNSYVGGFFYSRDLFPRATTPQFGAGCAGSNEGELFYMLAPDPGGAINGNVRTVALVDGITVSTIAHEFQHLINSSRRIYVNGAAMPEAVWLDEGLSHEAEELLYFRASGRASRQHLGDAEIRLASSAGYSIWKQDASQNFSRLAAWLENPGAASPDADDDHLSTRGATWSFLRYAADRLYAADGDVWFRLANSTTSGLSTLRLALGPDPVGLMRDWAMANYLDDLGVSGDARYRHASWNFRDIFTHTYIAARYPLAPTGLVAGASPSLLVQRNSAAYLRFAVGPNGEALLRFGGTGSAPPAAFQFLVVRTR
jgi:hypothetical protein